MRKQGQGKVQADSLFPVPVLPPRSWPLCFLSGPPDPQYRDDCARFLDPASTYAWLHRGFSKKMEPQAFVVLLIASEFR